MSVRISAAEKGSARLNFSTPQPAEVPGAIIFQNLVFAEGPSPIGQYSSEGIALHGRMFNHRISGEGFGTSREGKK
jgi:hypothetical protein